TNQSRDFGYHVFELMMPLDVDVAKVTATLKAIGAEMRADPAIAMEVRDDIEVFGIEKLSPAGATMMGRLRSLPGRQAIVGRDFTRRVLARLGSEGITFATASQTVLLKSAEPPASLPSSLPPASKA